MPSKPGLRDRELLTIVRGSEPPWSGRWHVPHETVLVDESCSSQNKALPRYAFAAVTSLPTGGVGGSSGGKVSEIVPATELPWLGWLNELTPVAFCALTQ